MAPVKKPKRDRQPHFFRAWRLHAGLTQEDVTLQLGWSQSKISRLEAAKTPYSQDDLEMAADLYGCTVLDLIVVDPNDSGSDWGPLIHAGYSEDAGKRSQIVSFAKFTLGLS